MTESISLEGLIKAAETRSGTRDVGAWLLTALLRSVGVDTRLVCSLQPLQFGFLNEGPQKDFYPAEAPPPTNPSTNKSARDNNNINTSSSAHAVQPPPSSRKLGSRNPVFPSSLRRETTIYTTPSQYIAETKTYSPNHPFFWSEAWDVASQKWIVLEAMVGARVNQPSRIEPPATPAAWETGAMGDNVLSYVVGFDNSTLSPSACR